MTLDIVDRYCDGSVDKRYMDGDRACSRLERNFGDSCSLIRVTNVSEFFCPKGPDLLDEI